MNRDNVRLLVHFSIAFVVTGWLAMIVSFWLPDIAGQALLSTALALGIPGLIGAVVGFVFEEELVDVHENRVEQVRKTHPLRCSDCGSKILDASGTTVGDQIEGELMLVKYCNHGFDKGVCPHSTCVNSG